MEQLAEARVIAQNATPPLLRAWLAAAHGEGLAAAGQRDDALWAFDTAGGLLPTDPADPSLPFLFLAGAHLDRWRGHALSRLGEPDAIDQITDALPRLPTEFIRARTSMIVDLAYAYAVSGDRDAAVEHARQAKRLAMQIKSDRQLRRLNGLILPAGGPSAARREVVEQRHQRTSAKYLATLHELQDATQRHPLQPPDLFGVGGLTDLLHLAPQVYVGVGRDLTRQRLEADQVFRFANGPIAGLLLHLAARRVGRILAILDQPTE